MQIHRIRMERFREYMESGNYEALSAEIRNDDDMNGQVGLLPNDLEKIRITTYNKKEFMNLLEQNLQDSCPICYENFELNENIMILPKCLHEYHPNCIKEWLCKSPFCPMCRCNVRSNIYANIP